MLVKKWQGHVRYDKADNTNCINYQTYNKCVGVVMPHIILNLLLKFYLAYVPVSNRM